MGADPSTQPRPSPRAHRSQLLASPFASSPSPHISTRLLLTQPSPPCPPGTHARPSPLVSRTRPLALRPEPLAIPYRPPPLPSTPRPRPIAPDLSTPALAPNLSPPPARKCKSFWGQHHFCSVYVYVFIFLPRGMEWNYSWKILADKTKTGLSLKTTLAPSPGKNPVHASAEALYTPECVLERPEAILCPVMLYWVGGRHPLLFTGVVIF
jgi:hypothetical protein